MSFNSSLPHKLAFLPPKIDFKNQQFLEVLLKARTEIAELKGYSFSMPNPMLLISPAIIKESVASSNIENINTTIVDVLKNQLFPEAEQREPDKEVLRYREALLWGFKELKKGMPISTRIILGIQRRLMPEAHGEYRKLQNQIENSLTKEILYTPPIASEIPGLIKNWEEFVNEKNDIIEPLIKCAITHYQFESIHPFDDGNGRTGRILMVLQLLKSDLLALPILYISGYINKNKSEYYKLLRNVTANEKWDEFIMFMLNAFYFQARETKEMLFKVMTLFFEFKGNLKKDYKKIYSADLAETLFSLPIITPVRLASELEIHYTTASRHLNELVKGGVLKEKKFGKYHFFINEQLLKLMNSK